MSANSPTVRVSVAPQGMRIHDQKVAQEKNAIARFEALDKDHDGKISYDEWRAQELARGNMYDGPRFQGEARIPFEAELTKLNKRIHHKSKCLALVSFMIFLLTYVGINLCYPRWHRGEFVSEVRSWIDRQQWGDGNSIQEVATYDQFWSWFDEVIVSGFWNTNETGTVLAFNNIVSGVTIAQRRKNYTTYCESFEAKLFDSCPRWPQMDSYISTGVDSALSSFLDMRTPLLQGPRTNFVFYELPIVTSDSSGERIYRDEDYALNLTYSLRQSGWLNESTAETIVIIGLYNPNTRLFSSIQIRFILQAVGGLKLDVIPWAGVLDTLGDSISLAGGAPWQLRITLELLFAVQVAVKAVRELIEVYVSVQKAVQKRRSSETKIGAIFVGFARYLQKFWNLVDALFLTLASLVITLQIEIYLLRNEVISYVTNVNSSNGELPSQSEFAAYLMKIQNLDALFDICNTLCLLVSFFRLFRAVEFHGHLGIVSRTISRAWTTLWHFGVVLFMVICGYVTVGWIMFSTRSEHFRTPIAALGSVGALMTVGVDYGDFLSMVETDQLTWWAYLPISMYYFGFLFIAAMLLLNVLLAIVLGAYEESQNQSQNLQEDTLMANMQEVITFHKKIFGISRRRPRNSKVDPQCAFLTPTDAEMVRPSLEMTYNEIMTVYEVLSGSKEVCVIPYRKLERDPLVVTFNYADLSQLFTDSVAMYLWALYGPGAPKGEPDIDPTVKEAEDQAARENSRLDKLAKNQQKLEQQITNLDAKLNLVLSALLNGPLPKIPAGQSSQNLHSPRPFKESINVPLLQTEILKKQSNTERLESPKSMRPIFSEPALSLQNTTHGTTGNGLSSLYLETKVNSPKPNRSGRSSASLTDTVSSSSVSDSSTSEHSALIQEAFSPTIQSLPMKHEPGVQNNAQIAVTNSSLNEGPSTGEAKKVEVEQNSSSEEKTSNQQELDQPVFRKEHEDPLTGPVTELKKENKEEIGGNTENNGVDKDQSLKNAFGKLMDELLASGRCPIGIVKERCKKHHPEIPWASAKAWRRDFDIIQRKDEVWTDHKTRSQIIRIWKRASTEEEFKALNNWNEDNQEKMTKS